MLGPQFDHTYWHDESGQQVQMTKGQSSKKSVDGFHRPARLDPEPATGYQGEWMNSERAAKGIQGSLFSPYVGTGLKEDPTVPRAKREAAAAAALGHIKGDYENAARDVRTALVESDTPIHEMGQSRINQTTVGDLGRASGDYHPWSKNMRVGHSKDTATLTHEMGHAADPQMGSEWNHRIKKDARYDPVEEGLADGRMDRYSTSDFDPNHGGPDAAERQRKRSRMQGYGEKSFGGDLDKALYNTTRHISVSSDRGVRSLPSRDALFSDRVGNYNPSKPEGGLFQGHPDLPVDYGDDESNRRVQSSMDKIMMGHIVENHPKSLSTLNEEQMGAATSAHEYYKRTAPKAFFDHPGETYEQLKIPGMR